MVSLRRRKLLGLCSGRNSFLSPLPKPLENGSATQSPHLDIKASSVHPVPMGYFKQPQETMALKVVPGTSDASGGSSSSKEQSYQQASEQAIKRRKRHRRKPNQNHEPCLMRGVYFKNMKWQAAIKVDKKQIHLGTVGSQEEAARLYDRAAFMCGREPNFELSEEEKQELRMFKWDEFLAMTRRAITTKKQKRRRARLPKSEPSSQNSDQDVNMGVSGFTAQVEEPDTSFSS